MLENFVPFTVIGFVLGATYSIPASCLVLTYATSHVFNIAPGSFCFFITFLSCAVHPHRLWPVPLSRPFLLPLLPSLACPIAVLPSVRVSRRLKLDGIPSSNRCQLARIARNTEAVGTILLPWQADLLRREPALKARL